MESLVIKMLKRNIVLTTLLLFVLSVLTACTPNSVEDYEKRTEQFITKAYSGSLKDILSANGEIAKVTADDVYKEQFDYKDENVYKYFFSAYQDSTYTKVNINEMVTQQVNNSDVYRVMVNFSQEFTDSAGVTDIFYTTELFVWEKGKLIKLTQLQ